MPPIRAAAVDLPFSASHRRTSIKPLSFLFDPPSQSLAVMLSDSSFLLFPSFSPLSPSPPPTPIPAPSTAASFLRLLPNPNSTSDLLLFISAAPSAGGGAVLLRAWIRRPLLFSPVGLSFKKQPSRSAAAGGVVLDIRHGLGVRIAGSANYFALHSVAASQIWILGARAVGEESVDLVKCAVIECVVPIYEIRVSMGFLMLGEVDGVRVFPLRPLVNGGRAAKRKGLSKKSGLSGATGCCCGGKGSEVTGGVDGRTDGCRAHCKLRTLKLRQNSGEFCSFFVTIRCAVDSDETNACSQASVKAVSIHMLSQKKFLVLDSVGDLYLLSLQNTVNALETTVHSSISSKYAYINRLDVTMKVQLMAILPDMGARRQTVWLSDGAHSVHVMSVADMESSAWEHDKDESKEKAMLISAMDVIFTSEKVQDIISLSANAVLILGQGNIFAYSIA